MTVVVWIASVMLVAATFLALTRIVRGPSALDRMVAMDVLLSCLIGAIGLEAAYNRHGTTLAVLAVLALLGFVGSVAVARFAAGEADAPPARAPAAGSVGCRPSSWPGSRPPIRPTSRPTRSRRCRRRSTRRS